MAGGNGLRYKPSEETGHGLIRPAGGVSVNEPIQPSAEALQRQQAAQAAAQRANVHVRSFNNPYIFEFSTGDRARDDAVAAAQQQFAQDYNAKNPLPQQPAAGGARTNTINLGGMQGVREIVGEDGTRTLEYGTPGTAGYGRMTVHPQLEAGHDSGRAQPQQLGGYGYDPEQARLATAMQRYGNIIRLGGESDRDFNPNSQVSIGGRGSLNPGYTFIGSAGDAARFFQPVPHGGGYNPYRRPIRTLFDEMGDARMAARNAPKPPTPPEGGWQTKMRTYETQMRNWDNEQARRQAYEQGRLGYDRDMAQQALQAQQMQQQYMLGLGNLANNTAQTQATLGQNRLQQQGQMLQMDAYQRWRNAPPGSPEQAQAAQEMQMLRGGGGTSGNDGGYGFQVIKVDNGDGSQSEALVRTNSRTGDASRVPLNQGQDGEIDFMPRGDQEKAILAQMSDADKARYERAKKAGPDQLREFWRLWTKFSIM